MGSFCTGPGGQERICPPRLICSLLVQALMGVPPDADEVDLQVLVYREWGLHRLTHSMRIVGMNPWMSTDAANYIGHAIKDQDETKVLYTRIKVKAESTEMRARFAFTLRMRYFDDDSLTWDGDYEGDLLLFDMKLDYISLNFPFARLISTAWPSS
jgi:hypothetical protein